MGKSLGDYNIKKSSSEDSKNIQWSNKNPIEGKQKKTGKKNPNSSSTNIIYSQNEEENEINKVFKIENNSDSIKSTNEISGKKYEKSSITNSKIKQGYKRKAR